jgi:hypothetical protein
MARRRVAAIALAAGSVAGTVLFRRRRRRNQARADLYFDDGSMISLAGDADDTAALMQAALAVLDG